MNRAKRLALQNLKNLNQRMTVEEKFWLNVDVRGEDECWPWLLGTNDKGYGRTSRGFAHRRAYEYGTGKKLGELLALHGCDNPPCCNPKHLFSGTHLDNSDDKIGKGRANYYTTLTKAEAELIKRVNMPQHYLAKLFEVWPSVISRIKRGVTYVSN